jgi:DNA segregation ATPase FtsK/SpoIIIE-like protein
VTEAKKESKRDALTSFVMALGAAIAFLSMVLLSGLLRRQTWAKKNVQAWGIYLVWLTLFVFAPRWNIPVILESLSPSLLPEGIGYWIELNIPRLMQVSILFFAPFLSWLFFFGVVEWLKKAKYQKGLDHLGLKTPTGLVPKIKRIIELEGTQKKIVVQAVGIDIAKLRDKKGALESSFNTIVQDIRVSPTSRQVYEILVSDKELPKLVRFDDFADKLTRPYTFLIGETMDKFITADLCEIHHMLIAGATGGGKSVFFKQALVGLLKSSQHLQLYLIDLKRGVDVKPFEVLENVEIAKDEASAISVLQAVVAEMERRFILLEAKGVTEINPERDGLDRIVVAIDEASVLFTVEKSSKATKLQAQNARELTDKIAKLGRAAGVHVILATQKVVKETIDTRVQTNINAKICFRVNTIASSMTVLGNKKAAELPDVKGRGIWSIGSNDLTVQVPRLNNEEVIEELSGLTAKFNGQNNPLNQPMLTLMSAPKEKANGFFKNATHGIKAQDEAEV